MFDLNSLSDALEVHGKVARIVLASVKGSAPRPVGTSMLVWQDGAKGTIGGGNLEFRAMQTARKMLGDGRETLVEAAALGPALNQCCGGAVTLITEVFDAPRFRAITTDYQGLWARPMAPDAGPLPEKLRRRMDRAQHADTPLPLTFEGGWLIEPLWRATREIIIYGAGHVGRALATVLAPLPQFEVILSDLRADQFEDLDPRIAARYGLPTEVMDVASDDAAHIIMTPEHDYDLELCHHLLGRKFHAAGLIGSATKWARFRKRLAALGHAEAQIDRITCPIGDPALGKHPQAIALGVAAHMLAPATVLSEKAPA